MRPSHPLASALANTLAPMVNLKDTKAQPRGKSYDNPMLADTSGRSPASNGRRRLDEDTAVNLSMTTSTLWAGACALLDIFHGDS